MDDIDSIFRDDRVSTYEQCGDCSFCGRKAQKINVYYDEDAEEYLGSACVDVEECGFYFRARTGEDQ